MNVLIIGGGGREHALGWKIKQSKDCERLFFAPGNAGTKRLGVNVAMDVSRVDTKTADEIGRFCREQKVGLVVIGPEDPLAAGLADRLLAAGLKVFGPKREAARLEADKGFSKQLMRSSAVPTAEAKVFTDANAALRYVEAHETPVVVKAAGLAKGKGVVVCDDSEQAAEAVRRIMVERVFGDAGERVVVEERLVGQEVSILALVDGRNLYVLEPSQDHKPVGEGDTGPNTGGMGAYTPTPLVDDAMLTRIEREVLVPTVDALRREGIEYKGVLYAGMMLTAGGPKVLEFNCRFGDPEIQALVARMRGDLLGAMVAAADGEIERADIAWDDRTACCVVLCSGGYPGEYRTGLRISGLEQAEQVDGVLIFHAGTAERDGEVVTAGGRVLNVVAVGATLAEAREKANEAAEMIHFDGAFFRRDIGGRVLVGR